MPACLPVCAPKASASGQSLEVLEHARGDVAAVALGVLHALGGVKVGSVGWAVDLRGGRAGQAAFSLCWARWSAGPVAATCTALSGQQMGSSTVQTTTHAPTDAPLAHRAAWSCGPPAHPNQSSCGQQSSRQAGRPSGSRAAPAVAAAPPAHRQGSAASQNHPTPRPPPQITPFQPPHFTHLNQGCCLTSATPPLMQPMRRVVARTRNRLIRSFSSCSHNFVLGFLKFKAERDVGVPEPVRVKLIGRQAGRQLATVMVQG